MVYLTLDKDFPSNEIKLVLTGREVTKLAEYTATGVGEEMESEVTVNKEENIFYNYAFPL